MPLIGENMTFGALCDHSRTQCAPVDALDEQPSGVASKKAAGESPAIRADSVPVVLEAKPISKAETMSF